MQQTLFLSETFFTDFCVMTAKTTQKHVAIKVLSHLRNYLQLCMQFCAKAD